MLNICRGLVKHLRRPGKCALQKFCKMLTRFQWDSPLKIIAHKYKYPILKKETTTCGEKEWKDQYGQLSQDIFNCSSFTVGVCNLPAMGAYGTRGSCLEKVLAILPEKDFSGN